MSDTPARKKILFLITKSNWGGAQRYVYDLATSLDDNRYEPVVALGGTGELSALLQRQQIRTHTVPALKNSLSPFSALSATHTLYKLLKKEQPEILHINSSVAGVVGVIAGRIARVPRIIFTAHAWAFNEDRPMHVRILLKCAHWLTVLLAHTTICVSNAVKQQMDWPGVSHKLTVINPGRAAVQHDSRAGARQSLITTVPQLTPYTDDIWIGTVAELHPTKRLSVAITAIKLLAQTHPNIRYVIIGEGHHRDTLLELVRDQQLTGRVFFTGALPEAAALMPAFDIFVLPSKSEAFGYVLLEAGLARVPVIATNVGGIPDIITHMHSGILIPPDEPKALCTALATLLEDTSLMASYADALHADVAVRTVEHMTEATTLVYESPTLVHN